MARPLVGRVTIALRAACRLEHIPQPEHHPRLLRPDRILLVRRTRTRIPPNASPARRDVPDTGAGSGRGARRPVGTFCVRPRRRAAAVIRAVDSRTRWPNLRKETRRPVGTRTPDLYRANEQFIDLSTTYKRSQGLLTSVSACKSVRHRVGRRVGIRPILRSIQRKRTARLR